MKKEILAVMAVVMVGFGGCAVGEDGVGETYEVSESVGTSEVDGGGSEVMSLAESMAESMAVEMASSMVESILDEKPESEEVTEVVLESTAVTTVRVVETEEETSVWTDEDSKSVTHSFYRRSEDESRTVTIESDVFPYDCEEMTIFVDSDAQRDFGAEGYLYIDLENLKNYPNLKRLAIGDFNGMAGGYIKIINGGSAAGLENLEEIELRNCTWWEEDWLSGIGSLRKLSIIGCRDYEGRLLKNLTQVETLCFDMCPIRDLSFINGMSSLNELVLTFARLNNTSFDGVEDNYSVKRVTIGLNHLYDAYDNRVLKDIAGLGKFKKLEYLKIPETKFIDDKVKALQEVLPECEIYDFMED